MAWSLLPQLLCVLLATLSCFVVVVTLVLCTTSHDAPLSALLPLLDLLCEQLLFAVPCHGLLVVAVVIVVAAVVTTAANDKLLVLWALVSNQGGCSTA